MTSWRDIAIARIASALLEYEVQCACLGQAPDPKDARKWLSDRYPFGSREYSPYKIWLQEVKLALVFVQSGRPAIAYQPWRGTVDSKGRHVGKKPQPKVKGQLSLLEGL